MQSMAGGDLLADLKRYLVEKQMLLILDNFEHLLDGVDLVSDLLEAAPRVCIVIASREALNILDEQIYSLDGLALPATYEVEGLLEYPAIQLFVERASWCEPIFRLRMSIRRWSRFVSKWKGCRWRWKLLLVGQK